MFEVLLTVDHKPLGIPYLRPPGDASSSSYVDLKESPARIAAIPELRNWHELKKTVEAITFDPRGIKQQRPPISEKRLL